MPLGPTRTPSATLAGAGAMLEQAARTSEDNKTGRAGVNLCMRVSWVGPQHMNAARGRFIPAPAGSALAALHGAFHFALAFAVADGVALVVLGLALGQRHVALDLAGLPVQV